MDSESVEIVERKERGHPDSICDALAETMSRNLCRYYLDRFGEILHHNVDNAPPCGGSAAPRFGGGEVVAPVEYYLSARATEIVGETSIPLDEIPRSKGSRAWLRGTETFAPDRHVRLHDPPAGLARPGRVFRRSSGRGLQSALASDTSFGVGYAPMTALELLVLRTETLLNGRPQAIVKETAASRRTPIT